MATPTEIKVVAEVLADPANASATAEEVAEKVWAVVERQRARAFKYVVLAQARRGPSQGRTGYFPTWVRGPYYTKPEAHSGAQEERVRLEAMGFTVNNKNGDAAVMAAELFDVDVVIDPSTLKEVAV